MKNPTPVIIAAAACFVSLVAGVVVLVIFAPEGADVGDILAQLFTGLASLGAVVASVMTRTKVEAVSKSVDYLANGGMDSKTRAGMADIIKPEFLRDDAAAQLDADRANRAAGPTGDPTTRP